MQRIMLSLFVLTVAALIEGGRAPPAGAAEDTRRCELPDELGPGDATLPKTAAALTTDGAIRIVAIGSGSTAGAAAGGPEYAYPARFAAALRAKYPSASVTVVNRGIARATAQSMLERVERDALAERPTLVLWETGTVDSVRHTDIADFHDAVDSGVEKIKSAGAEVVLIDTQFSIRTDSVINAARYNAELREVAGLREVPLFPRHDLMRHWAETGVFAYNATPRAAQREMIRGVYDCIGRALATFVTRAFPRPATADR